MRDGAHECIAYGVFSDWILKEIDGLDGGVKRHLTVSYSEINLDRDES